MSIIKLITAKDFITFFKYLKENSKYSSFEVYLKATLKHTSIYYPVIEIRKSLCENGIVFIDNAYEPNRVSKYAGGKALLVDDIYTSITERGLIEETDTLVVLVYTLDPCSNENTPAISFSERTFIDIEVHDNTHQVYLDII